MNGTLKQGSGSGSDPVWRRLHKERSMFAASSIRALLTAAIIVSVAIWSAPAQADENGPDTDWPGWSWWNYPDGTTIKVGWNFDENDPTDPNLPDPNEPSTDEGDPDWYTGSDVFWPGAEPLQVDGSTVIGLRPSNDAQEAEIVIHVDNEATLMVKNVLIQFDVKKSPGASFTTPKPEPEWEDDQQDRSVNSKKSPAPKNLGNGWNRYGRWWVISPQPKKEVIRIKLKTLAGGNNYIYIDNVWILTHCEQQSDSNHCEGHQFPGPFVPPDSPEPAFYYAGPWYEGTEWAAYGAYVPEWMPEVTDHQGVFGMPPGAAGDGHLEITFDDQSDPSVSRHIFYQYDRYTGAGEVFTEDLLPPGTIIENREERVEELDEGWERVQVWFDANPQPDWEGIHFVMLSPGADPVVIGNLIMCAGRPGPLLGGVSPSEPGDLATPISVAPVARWSENFDSYEAGSGLRGQGGWKGWDNDPAFDAFVSDAQACSAPHSVDIQEAADLVHEFDSYSSGKWAFTAWQYIPADFASDNDTPYDPGTYFLLLNTYNDGGPYNWSVQYNFDSNDGMLKVCYGNGQNTIDVPYITERWVKLQADIDLDNDLVAVSYDGAFIVEYGWTGGIYGEGGGALEIGAVDLFANGSTSVYYDDFSLRVMRTP